MLKQGKAVRAMVRIEDERAQALRAMGAEVVVGDLLDLDSMHRVIAGCETMYFGISDAYHPGLNSALSVPLFAGCAVISMPRLTNAPKTVSRT